ncbi:glycosyltransferase family 2 protein [Rhodoferax lacus]|uniref:Glycosyltransferase family 2 protein n=1 Tax=Rhodoferax lacus TaxID=2184758 RepID=A0A3E1RF44_9BURK|nr:glycosyltransferase family 2 protein [Rhodoferax lacus]RFO97984.1 glycosyltransferase family 2 protein [Rhodoferax lacus]
MDISIIIVSYNTAHLLHEVMATLRAASAGLQTEILFVDNASKDNSVEIIQRDFPACQLIVNKQNVGFGRANNQALPLASGRYVLLVNTDAFVEANTLTSTLAYMDAHPKCGILGVRLEGRDGVLQPCARYFPTPWNTFLLQTGLNRIFKHTKMVDDMNWAHDSVRSVDWVVGCYYLVRREVIAQVGLFDPRYFLYLEEVDHCLAAKKAGWEVVFYPHTTVIHWGGESAKSEGAISQGGRQLEALQTESSLLYYRKNHGLPGAMNSLVLSGVAEVMNTCKRLLKGRQPFGFADAWRRLSLQWSLWLRTSWGTRPTR